MQSVMYDQPQPSGGPSGSLTCYNCGGSGHFMVACPEQTRKVPAGLAAARAVGASASPELAVDNDQDRPFKRQKTGAVVTRYPRPGPVVTRYAAPPTTSQIYPVQSHYGSQPVAQYAQTVPYPYSANQHYGPATTSQPPVAYQTYPQQTTYGQSMVGMQQYAQNPTAGPQGYGPPQLYGPQRHGAPYVYGQTAPQYDSYSAVHESQQYGHEHHQQYGSQSGTGQVQQSPHPYQGSSLPPAVYNSSPQPHLPQSSQQCDSSGPKYDGSLSQHGQYENQQSYPSYHQNIAHQCLYQNNYGASNHQNHFSGQGPAPPDSSLGMTLGYNPSVNVPQYPATAPQHDLEPNGVISEAENLAKAESRLAELEWEMAKIFEEMPHDPAVSTARPLPHILEEEPIRPPASDNKRISTKYVRPNNLEVYKLGIRKSLHWGAFRQDVVFDDIDFDSPLISFDEIGIWIAERDTAKLEMSTELDESSSKNIDGDVPDEQIVQESLFESNRLVGGRLSGQSSHGALIIDETSRRNRSETPCFQLSDSTGVENPGTPVVEADDDAWAPQPGESNLATTPAAESEDPTEAILAALGVSGVPKPVLRETTSFNSTSGFHGESESSTDTFARQPSRQDSGYASARGSYSYGTAKPFDYSGSQVGRQTYHENQPPPPPPPPARKQFDGPVESDGTGRLVADGPYSSQNAQNRGPRGTTPLSPTSSDLLNLERKAPTPNSIGKKPEPMRQEDDVTPRMKRRQPKVAEAYSRRW